ncbi:MAG: SDR family oxidoreductase [Desulfobacteraceae bacterium]|nr:MAG: SDR family oxidoreductase [Desulfobacteraceae bacterium]
MKPVDRQTILITGATDGIGKLTALELARRQAHLLVHGRNSEKLARVVAELKAASANKNIEGFTADFSSIAQVRRLAGEVLATYPALDVLINNAGVGSAEARYSADGHELRFAVNYLAPFLLTHLVLPAVKKAAPARIVNVSSAGQYPVDFDDVMLEKHFDGSRAYSQSKLALIMFTIDLAAQLTKEQVTVNCLHPGTYLNTNMVRRAGVTPRGEPQSGADAVVFLAVSPDVADTTGKYFNVKTEARPNAQADDAQARKRLRELSLKLTGLTQ